MKKFTVYGTLPYEEERDKDGNEKLYTFMAFERYDKGDIVIVSYADGSLHIAKVAVFSEDGRFSSGGARPIICKVDVSNLELYEEISSLEEMRAQVRTNLALMEYTQDKIDELMSKSKEDAKERARNDS